MHAPREAEGTSLYDSNIVKKTGHEDHRNEQCPLISVEQERILLDSLAQSREPLCEAVVHVARELASRFDQDTLAAHDWYQGLQQIQSPADMWEHLKSHSMIHISQCLRFCENSSGDSVRRLRAANDAYCSKRNDLLKANMRWAYSMAASFARKHKTLKRIYTDLQQAAVMGLATAIDRHDTAFNTRVITFAEKHILNSMQACAAELYQGLRITQRVLTDAKKVGQIYALQGDKNTVRTALYENHISTQRAQALLKVGRTVSLQAPLGGEELGTVIAAAEPPPDAEFDYDGAREIFSKAKLNPRELRVLEMRWCMQDLLDEKRDKKPLASFEEIATALGVTERHAKLILTSARNKMKYRAAQEKSSGKRADA